MYALKAEFEQRKSVSQNRSKTKKLQTFVQFHCLRLAVQSIKPTALSLQRKLARFLPHIDAHHVPLRVVLQRTHR